MAKKYKILVPVDFTKEGEMALDMALEFGQFRNAEIYLFYVNEGSVKDYRELDRVNAAMMEKMKEMVMESIQRAADVGVTRTVEEVFRRLSNGKAWQEILKMASNINCDLIVMGLRPKGKTIENVIKKCPCSVALAREKDTEFVMA